MFRGHVNWQTKQYILCFMKPLIDKLMSIYFVSWKHYLADYSVYSLFYENLNWQTNESIPSFIKSLIGKLMSQYYSFKKTLSWKLISQYYVVKTSIDKKWVYTTFSENINRQTNEAILRFMKTFLHKLMRQYYVSWKH